MSSRSILYLCVGFVLTGCSARPLDRPWPDGFVPGFGPGSDGGAGGGGSGGSGGSGGNGGGGGGGGNPGNPPASPRLIAPASTTSVTTHRPHLRWDMTGVQGAATVELCRDRSCMTPLGSATLDASGDGARPDADLPVGAVFWRVHAGKLVSATWEFFVGQGNGAVDGAYGAILDVNGDGIPDVAATTTSSSVIVYPGGMKESSRPPIILASPDGPKAGFGYVIAAAGDLNGDGYGDLAIGECGTSFGDVFVYYGGPDGVAPMPSQSLSAPDAKSGFGCRLSGAGDLDGDGYAELAVARIGQDFSGGLYIYKGGANGLPTTTTRIDSPDRTPSRLGYSLAAVGDVDGDGFDDFVASELEYSDLSGQAHLYFGGKDGISNARVTSIPSPDGKGLQFGGSVSSAGDVNGDGRPDFIVAAPAVSGYSVTPVLHVFAGDPNLRSGASSQALPAFNGELGYATEAEGGGDLDGDGFGDVIASSVDGLTQLFGSAKGAGNGVDIAAKTQPTNPRHVVVAGDLDGDGTSDVLVSDGAGVEVLFGGAGGLSRSRVMPLSVPSGMGSFSGAVR